MKTTLLTGLAIIGLTTVFATPAEAQFSINIQLGLPVPRPRVIVAPRIPPPCPAPVVVVRPPPPVCAPVIVRPPVVVVPPR
ncbi:MAG TPA: hypothetical protein DCY13_00585, partial [Verrucomicrobiales bacterium]|nr:hypothetical protein [Verrucomicrobiales bacterium]